MEPKQAQNGDEMLSISAAAQIAGVHVGTLRRWEKTGRLRPARTPGGQRRYRRRDVVELLQPTAPTGSVDAEATGGAR